MSCRAPSCSTRCGGPPTAGSSTASSRRCTRSVASSGSRVGSRPSVASGTGSSSSAELAAALHRLRSTLARVRAELEVADGDRAAPPVEVLLADLREALELLGDVESAALGVVRVLVVDDDERLGELTARGLRRLGYD